MIPVSNPGAQYRNYEGEIQSAIDRVLGSGSYILASEVSQFELEFSKFLGSNFGIGVASGTDALRLSLIALDIGPGKEVIIPAMTSVSTAMAILSVGARPVLSDVSDETSLITAEKAEPIISKNTAAIIPVHLYGQSCNMHSFRELSEIKGLELIEDCAQAHGAQFKGQSVGTIGKVGCFSFYPTKNLSAFGDGGLITTNCESIAEKLQMLRQNGFSKPQISEIEGVSSRLDEIQAAILRVKLNYLEEMNNLRNRIASTYTSAFSDLPVICPVTPHDGSHVFHQYVIRVQRRQDFVKFLHERNVGTAIHYPLPIHRQPFWRVKGWDQAGFPISDKLSSQIVSLPIDPFLTDKEQNKVIEIVKKYFEGN
tara:strand:+ start:109 stop:1212 length:1104 start_codon:yes stop_codon:yes gene_type:complete